MNEVYILTCPIHQSLLGESSIGGLEPKEKINKSVVWMMDHHHLFIYLFILVGKLLDHL